MSKRSVEAIDLPDGDHIKFSPVRIRHKAIERWEECVMPNPKDDLKARLACYCQIKLSVIGRRTGQTISNPDLGRTNDEQRCSIKSLISYQSPILASIVGDLYMLVGNDLNWRSMGF
jgi:hypothetical protein